MDALQKPAIVNTVVKSLISPLIPCRQIAAEILSFFCHFDIHTTPRLGLSMILTAFDRFEQEINETIVDIAGKVGKFELWLKQFEQMMDSRGRMGSMVGASKELRGADVASIMECCVCLPCPNSDAPH